MSLKTDVLGADQPGTVDGADVRGRAANVVFFWEAYLLISQSSEAAAHDMRRENH